MRPQTIFPILIILIFLPGCSVIHEIFRKTEAPAPQGQVVRMPIPRERLNTGLNTGGTPTKIIKRGHSYIYDTVGSARTQQFVITEMPVLINAPERAVKVRLNPERAVRAKRVEMKKALSGKSIKPESPKGPQSKQVTPDRPIKTLAVSFAINSSALSPHETGKLRHFIEHMGLLTRNHESQQPRAVDVVGYTCWLGSKKYNQSLALKRARAVALHLKKAGIIIRSVSGKGKCCYIDRKNPSPNRRAEVTVIRPGL